MLLTRVHAIPRECHRAFVWLMELCKGVGIQVSDISFTSTKQGGFLKVEGTICLNAHAATFLVSDVDGSMSVYVTTRTGKRYRVYPFDARPTYPLEELMVSEEDALARVMGGLSMRANVSPS